MDEEKTTQNKPVETTPNTDVGEPSATEEEIVRRAKEENNRQEILNKEKGELLAREEKLMERKEALAKLGGGSPAGTGDSEKKEEISPKEYAEKALSGELNVKKE